MNIWTTGYEGRVTLGLTAGDLNLTIDLDPEEVRYLIAELRNALETVDYVTPPVAP